MNQTTTNTNFAGPGLELWLDMGILAIGHYPQKPLARQPTYSLSCS